MPRKAKPTRHFPELLLDETLRSKAISKTQRRALRRAIAELHDEVNFKTALGKLKLVLLKVAYVRRTCAMQSENAVSFQLFERYKQEELRRREIDIQNVEIAPAEHLEKFLSSTRGLKYLIATLEVIATDVKDQNSLSADNTRVLLTTFGQEHPLTRTLIGMTKDADAVGGKGTSSLNVAGRRKILAKIKAAQQEFKAGLHKARLDEERNAEAVATRRCAERAVLSEDRLRHERHTSQELRAALDSLDKQNDIADPRGRKPKGTNGS